MQSHIEQTLTDIDQKIARLESLKIGLRCLYDGEVVAELRDKADHQTEPKKPRKPYTRRNCPDRDRSPVAARRAMKGSKIARANKINDAILRLTEPFTPNAVRDAIGVANGSSTCNRLENKGLIKRIGKGQYERTAKFPTSLKSAAAEALKAAHPAPKADEETINLDDIKQQITDYILRRDDARSKGQDKVAAIYQKRINELDAHLVNAET